MAIDDLAAGAAAGAAGAPLGAAAGAGGFWEAAGAAVSAGISEQAMNQAAQAAQGLKDAAGSGQIRITPEGFDILINALNQCDTHRADLTDNISKVTQAPQLGSSTYAGTVATHVQQGGTGQPQSADMVVQQLGEVFKEVREALNKAKQAYEDNEHATVRKLK